MSVLHFQLFQIQNLYACPTAIVSALLLSKVIPDLLSTCTLLYFTLFFKSQEMPKWCVGRGAHKSVQKVLARDHKSASPC